MRHQRRRIPLQGCSFLLDYSGVNRRQAMRGGLWQANPEHRLVLDQVQTKPGLLALEANTRIGQPDRRHQVTLRKHRQDARVDLVGLARQRR